MKQFEEYTREFLAALSRLGQDCRNNLEWIWADFREDMADLWTELCRDMRTLWERYREMCGALAAEVRLAVHKWIG